MVNVRHGALIGFESLRRSLPYAAALVTLFAAALIANRRVAGTSPIVWTDTFNDEQEVQACVVRDSCTLGGMGSSVPGLYAGVAWLELRSALSWLGLSLDDAHLVVEMLDALALVLVFDLASQLGGALAGAAAAWLFMDRMDDLFPVAALHNVNLLVFLGAVFVLACAAAVARPGVVSVALAALVGAIIANVHLASVAVGASVAWVALAAPRRRLALAIFGAGLFVLATVVIAPPMWVNNLTTLIQHPSGHAIAMPTLPVSSLMRWMGFGLIAWVASFASRRPAWVTYRRRSLGAIAVVAPCFATFILAPHVGVNPYPKYLVHAKAASAIVAALPIAASVGFLLRSLISRRMLGRLERAAPFALAAVIAVPGGFGVGPNEQAKDGERPTIADLANVAAILHDVHGWDLAHIIERLKSPDGGVLTGLRGMGAAIEGPPPVAADVAHGAMLIMLDSADLPEVLPANWTVVHRAAHQTTVLIFVPSRIDWSEFAVCAQTDGEPAPRCVRSGWRVDPPVGIVVPNMPPQGVGWRGTLQLSFDLLPATPGVTDEVFMPRMGTVCSGRIVSAPNGSALNSDGRRAVMSAADPDQRNPSVITLEWQIDSPECGDRYNGLPPFFVEGDVQSVRLIEEIARRHEGWGA